MKRLGFVLGLLGALGICTGRASADTTSLQSIRANVNGALQGAPGDPNAPYAGFNTGGFDTTTGIGTLTYTFNAAPGTYFFDVFFDHQLNLPFWNEFGTVLGGPATGQSYEIGDSFASNIYPDVQAGGPLSNMNTLPGTTSNYLLNPDGSSMCSGPNCNGDFAAAMGFSFVLGAGEQEVLTFSVSHTDPGSGLRLEDTHPVDAANPVALNLFISGSAATVPTGGTVPEPNFLILLAVMGIVLVVWRKVTEPSV